MPVIETLIDAHSPDFARNRDALLASLQHLRLLEQNLLSKAQQGAASQTQVRQTRAIAAA